MSEKTKTPIDELPTRIAVLTTESGEKITVCCAPTIETVREFAAEQNRRAEAKIPAGPSGIKAERIVSAIWVDDQNKYVYDIHEESPLELYPGAAGA